METSRQRTLKIIPRNLNEIVRSWFRLLYSFCPFWLQRINKKLPTLTFLIFFSSRGHYILWHQVETFSSERSRGIITNANLQYTENYTENSIFATGYGFETKFRWNNRPFHFGFLGKTFFYFAMKSVLMAKSGTLLFNFANSTHPSNYIASYTRK